MRIRSMTSLLMLAALAAAPAVLSLGQSEAAHAGSLSFVPSEDDLMFRRYRGDDEVSDHDRGRGRGRGRGGHDSESGNSGGHSSLGNSGSSDSSGPSPNSKSGGSDRDDVDDRFGK